MATPIQPTPVITDEDAVCLLEELANVCSPEEAQRRIAQARRDLAELSRPKNRQSDVQEINTPQGALRVHQAVYFVEVLCGHASIVEGILERFVVDGANVPNRALIRYNDAIDTEWLIDLAPTLEVARQLVATRIEELLVVLRKEITSLEQIEVATLLPMDSRS